jgi:hypothetical protein
MFSRTFVTLSAIIAVAQALPSPQPQPLSFDDVVVINRDGSSSVMKASEYDALVARAPVRSAIESVELPAVSKRACKESTELQVLSDDKFLNWDVPMSPVLHAAGGGATTVSVSSGYTLTNSVSVGSSAGASLFEGLLSLSLSVSYDESWSTSQEQSLSFSVPDGQFGIVVSQPMVRRVLGNIMSGCTDSPVKTSFTSDTYSSQTFGNLEWVQGVIRLCNSTTYPIPFCNGEGSHS